MSFFNDFARTIVLALLVSVPVSAWAAGGYIFDSVGAVYVSQGKGKPHPVVVNEALSSGTVVGTGANSHAVLKFEDGQVVSLQSNSTFQVREYRYVPKDVAKSNVVFAMFKGGMRFITGRIGQYSKKSFRLVTPHATIGIRGTDFMVAMANKATFTQVISGSVTSTNAAGMTTLTAGQTAMTSSATALTTAVPVTSVPAGTFSQIASIPVPAATPAPVPPPVPAAAPVVAPVVAPVAAAPVAAPVSAGAAATTAGTTAGAAAAGGATAGGAAATGGLIGGLSATTIGIGVGVAAVAAAVINSSTTQH